MEPTRHTVALVAVGGAAGACLRYAVAQAAPTSRGEFPLTTLIINLIGAFLLGLLIELLVVWRGAAHWPRPLLGAGLLGGFTTFSTMTVELVQLLDNGSLPTAVAYAAASVLGGAVAAWLGIHTAKRHPAYQALPIDPEIDE
jgi:CrcB protein